MPAAKPLPHANTPGIPTMAWEPLVKLRYRWWPDHLAGEILSKRWTETAIPVLVLALVASLLAAHIDGFFSEGNLAAMLRQAGEVSIQKEKVVSSPRRWEKMGLVATTLLYAKVRRGFARGIAPEKLKEIYLDVR